MNNEIVFGAGRLHHLSSVRERQRVIISAFDIGIRAFDVAPSYGNGINEVEIGVALLGKRDCCEINTKYGIPVPAYSSSSRHFFSARRILDKVFRESYQAYQQRAYSPKELEDSLDRSLKRLQTEYVDTFFIHEPIAPMSQAQLDDIVDCSDRMKKKGKIKAFGVAGLLESIRHCPSIQPFDVIQIPCKDLNRENTMLSNKEVILYGAYRAYKEEAGRLNFCQFVKNKMKYNEGVRMIVASKLVEVVRSFSQLIS